MVECVYRFNFTPAQIHVSLVIHWPGKAKQSFNHHTNHSAITVTLMKDLFHTQNAIEDFSLGYYLSETQRNDWFISGSYVNYAIVEKDRHIVTYLSGNYETWIKRHARSRTKVYLLSWPWM